MTNNLKGTLNDVFGYADTDDVFIQFDFLKFIKLAKLQLQGMKASIDKAYYKAQENNYNELAVGLEQAADQTISLFATFADLQLVIQENEEHKNDE